jgi:hypothetical protein
MTEKLKIGLTETNKPAYLSDASRFIPLATILIGLIVNELYADMSAISFTQSDPHISLQPLKADS